MHLLVFEYALHEIGFSNIYIEGFNNYSGGNLVDGLSPDFSADAAVS